MILWLRKHIDINVQTVCDFVKPMKTTLFMFFNHQMYILKKKTH